jgi:hypothetical protein
LAFVLRGVFPWKIALLYWASHLAAAFLSALLLVGFLELPNMDKLSAIQNTGLSFSATWFLLTVILFTAHEAQVQGLQSAFPVAGVVAIIGWIKRLGPLEINPTVLLGKAIGKSNLHGQVLSSTLAYAGAAFAAVVLRWIVLGGPKAKEKHAARGDGA